MKKFIKSQRGFTLIEIIISIVVIIVIFEICFMEVMALQISRKQRYEDVAYQVANKQMEKFRALAVSDLPGSGSISDTLLSDIPSGVGTYAVTDYSGYAGMKEIVVTVTWNDGAAKSVVLRTLAQDGGINP